MANENNSKAAQDSAGVRCSSVAPGYTKKDIPEGAYCYTMLSWDGCKMKVKPCPFWSIRDDKPEQQNGYCSFLKEGDWEGEGFSLLWDQVKECGENYGDDPYGTEEV